MRRPAPLALVLLLTLLAAAACGGGGSADDPTATPTTEAPCDDQREEPVVSVELGDNFFAPECILAVQTQGLRLENTGAAIHSFTITEGDVDFDLDPGEPFNVDGPIPLEPKEWAFTCKYHPEMTGTLTIETSNA